MGSLISKPKRPRPRLPDVVYVPSPPVAPAAPSPPPPPAVPPPAASDPEAEAARERVTAILKSRRGVSGTVLTGLRGFLDPAAAWPRRKTLLGE